MRSLFHTVPWPSGKARVCKTLIPQFKSGRYLQMLSPGAHLLRGFFCQKATVWNCPRTTRKRSKLRSEVSFSKFQLALGMFEYRAHFGEIGAHHQVAVVAALPDGDAALFKYGFGLHVLQQRAVALFVGLFRPCRWGISSPQARPPRDRKPLRRIHNRKWSRHIVS